MAVGKGARAGFDQERVGVAMVATGELDDFIPAGEPTGKAHSGHGGFGATAGQADFLDRWNQPADELGHFDFVGIGRAIGGAVLEGGGDGGFDNRVIVTVNRGAPRADKIDEFAIVGGDQRRAVGGLDKERRTTDGAKGPNGRIHTTRNEAASTGEEGIGHGIEHGKKGKS